MEQAFTQVKHFLHEGRKAKIANKESVRYKVFAIDFKCNYWELDFQTPSVSHLIGRKLI
jgi:predicted GNAT family N-acyltransferase